MTLTLRILLILSSVLVSCTVIRRIRKSKMQIDDAVFWVLFSLVLIVLAVFPHIIYWISIRTGIQSPANLLYLLIIFVLIMKIFSMRIKLSILESKITKLEQDKALEKIEK